MRAFVSLVALVAISTPASAGLLIYEGFDYAPGVNLTQLAGPPVVSGQNNGYATWGDFVPTPAQNANFHPIAAGNLTLPGLPAPTASSNSLSVANDVNGVMSRIVLPNPANTTSTPGVGFYHANSPTGPSIFFSFALQLTNADAAVAGADYYFAGFHANGATGGMGVGGGYGYMLHLRRSPSSAGTDAEQEYELGVSKNNATGWSLVWDEVNKFKADEPVFVVGEYKFVGANPALTGQSDDVASLWVGKSGVNGVAFGSPTAVSATGPDVTGNSTTPVNIRNQVSSFWFRSDNNVPGDLLIDELRIGTSFASVTVPEPATALLALAGAATLGAYRRRRQHRAENVGRKND
jgi:MYXO-CTERM domain-containing protein